MTPAGTEERVDIDGLLWAASPENRDDETRSMAKDILDTLCYIEHAVGKQSAKTEKRT